MSQHRGRDEVQRRRARLINTLKQIDGAALSPELLAHYSRYAAVLISGYAEQSVKELVREYSRNCADRRLQRYVGQQVEKLRNIDAEKLKQLIVALDPKWWDELERDHADELDAFKSIATVRNNVSHGGDSGITMSNANDYFSRIDVVVKALSQLLDPRS